MSEDFNTNYKLRYQDLLYKMQELKKDQQETFLIHADTVIKLQDKIKEKDSILKRRNGINGKGLSYNSEIQKSSSGIQKSSSGVQKSSSVVQKSSLTIDSWSDSELEKIDRRDRQDRRDRRDRREENRNEQEQDENVKIVEILKYKIEFMKSNYEETNKYYNILQERDQETILQLTTQVQDLTLKLKNSANQVNLLTETSEKFKTKLDKLLEGFNETYRRFQRHKEESEARIQELREIYVSETQSGIEKNSKINQLQIDINDKNREIHVLRKWLRKVKGDLRDKERLKAI